MEPGSDIVVNATAFDPQNASEGLLAMKVASAQLDAIAPRWYRVGAAKYRDMVEKGETPWPAPTYLAGAVDSGIPSSESGREIPTRVYEPENGRSSKGILLYFHPGGWVCITSSIFRVLDFFLPRSSGSPTLGVASLGRASGVESSRGGDSRPSVRYLTGTFILQLPSIPN